LTILSFLLLTGHKRQDFFLAKGKIDAPVEPSKLLGMRKPEPWTRIGSIFAVVFGTVMFVFLVLSSRPSLNSFGQALPLIPVALLIAAINAFNEEFTLRAAPLSQLWSTLGKQQALMITTAFFGLGHFYGIPWGVLGVLLSSFLGWFLGKSMLETRGFFWAWLIHFIPDAFIFTFFAISAVA
jgi:membrane protease YdiL (CAAX protease family)